MGSSPIAEVIKDGSRDNRYVGGAGPIANLALLEIPYDAVGRSQTKRAAAGEHDRVHLLNGVGRVEERRFACTGSRSAHVDRRNGAGFCEDHGTSSGAAVEGVVTDTDAGNRGQAVTSVGRLGNDGRHSESPAGQRAAAGNTSKDTHHEVFSETSGIVSEKPGPCENTTDQLLATTAGVIACVGGWSPQMPYTLLADLLVVVHLSFVVFVILGGLLVGRRAWVVWLHLPAVCWGVGIEWMGGICPLTPLETWLRSQASEGAYESRLRRSISSAVLVPSGADQRHAVRPRKRRADNQRLDLRAVVASTIKRSTCRIIEGSCRSGGRERYDWRRAGAIAIAVACLSACGQAPPDRGAGQAVAGERPVSLRADRPFEADAPRLVVLGDSLTAGLGLAATEAYPARLQERLDAAGYHIQIVSAGVSGDTTAGGLRRLEWALDGGAEVLIVALGGNDGLRGLPVDQMKANLSQIVTTAKARGVEVLLAGMEAPPNFGEVYTAAFRDVFHQLAREHDGGIGSLSSWKALPACQI